MSATFYIIGVKTSIINEWIKTGMKERPEEMVAMITTVMDSVPKNIYKQNKIVYIRIGDLGGDIMKEIKERRSICKYKNKEVEKEKILQLIESAALAPSGSNTQPWNFIIVTSEDIK